MPKVIEVNGTIVSNDDAWIYDWFDIECTCPKKIKDQLKEANGDEVIVKVNSGGGDLFAGNDIYYMLTQYAGKVTVDISGIAASAATLICCAGDVVRANPGIQYMVHNVSTMASGDYKVMDKTSSVLKNANKSISNIYRLKTGMSNEELLKMMNEETWMDAEKAKSYGFIDEIIGDDGMFSNNPITITNSVAKVLSDEVKQKIRDTVKVPGSMENAEPGFLMQQEQLNLLKLRGELRR